MIRGTTPTHIFILPFDDKTIDAVVDENGKPVRDEKGNLIPTGKMIIQQPTNIKYEEAIDVENAPYTYIESDKDIETVSKDGETLEN